MESTNPCFSPRVCISLIKATIVSSNQGSSLKNPSHNLKPTGKPAIITFQARKRKLQFNRQFRNLLRDRTTSFFRKVLLARTNKRN